MTAIADPRRHQDLRDRRAVAQDRLVKLRSAAGNENLSSDVRRTAREQLRGAELDLEAAETALHRATGDIARAHLGRPGAQSGHAVDFLDDPGTAAMLEQLAYSESPIGNMPLGTLCSSAQLAETIRSGRWGGRAGDGSTFGADPGGLGPVDVGEAARIGAWRGILPALRRALRLIDVVQTQTMDNNSFNYTQELVGSAGGFDTATEVDENALRAEANIAFHDETVTAVTVGHWFKTSRESIADVASLRAALNTRLTYGVLRKIDAAILNGTGKLKGILQQAPGAIGSVDFDGDVPLSDLPLDGFVETVLADAVPDAIVAHPSDVAAMLKAVATTSGERLDSAGAFAGGLSPLTIWGLPAILTPVIAQGSLLVGSFAEGATLWVREGVNVRTSDSDQDDFSRGRLTFLGESRVGLSVERPSCFTLVHLADES